MLRCMNLLHLLQQTLPPLCPTWLHCVSPLRFAHRCKDQFLSVLLLSHCQCSCLQEGNQDQVVAVPKFHHPFRMHWLNQRQSILKSGRFRRICYLEAKIDNGWWRWWPFFGHADVVARTRLPTIFVRDFLVRFRSNDDRISVGVASSCPLRQELILSVVLWQKKALSEFELSEFVSCFFLCLWKNNTFFLCLLINRGVSQINQLTLPWLARLRRGKPPFKNSFSILENLLD